MRLDAFLDAAQRHAIDLDTLPIAEAKRFDEDEGYRCAREILDAAPDATALLCANDRLAPVALRAISHAGLQCPRDISLTGFNDMPLLDLIPPGLTTVRILQVQAGQTAARHLLALLRGDDDAVPTETILPVELVERASVAVPFQ